VALLLVTVARLPVLELHVTDGPGGAAIMAARRPDGARGLLRCFGRSALVVPRSGVVFRGRRSHSQRNQVNRALQGGLQIESVTADHYAARAAEMGYARPACYPCAGLYLIGSAGAEVIAATHLHVDGRVAQLQAAVHRPGHRLTGPARYAMFQRVVEELAAREVGVLVNLDNYFTLPDGLRVFERRLGMTPVNVYIRRSRAREGIYRWRLGGRTTGRAGRGRQAPSVPTQRSDAGQSSRGAPTADRGGVRA